MKNAFEFHTAEQVISLCKKHKLPISEIAKKYEAERSNKSIPTIRNKMKRTRDIMYEAVKKGVKSTQKSKMGMVGGDANKLHKALKKTGIMMFIKKIIEGNWAL